MWYLDSRDPGSDRSTQIDARLQEMDGRTVAQAVRVEPLAGKVRGTSVEHGRILGEKISHAKSGQGRTAVIDEEWLRRGRCQSALADVRAEQLRGLRP